MNLSLSFFFLNFLRLLPAGSSWLNLVERLFGELTGKRLHRGAFVSVADLVAAVEEYLVAWNTNPKPFIWTATVESIREKLARSKQTLERIQPGAAHYHALEEKEEINQVVYETLY